MIAVNLTTNEYFDPTEEQTLPAGFERITVEQFNAYRTAGRNFTRHSLDPDERRRAFWVAINNGTGDTLAQRVTRLENAVKFVLRDR